MYISIQFITLLTLVTYVKVKVVGNLGKMHTFTQSVMRNRPREEKRLISNRTGRPHLNGQTVSREMLKGHLRVGQNSQDCDSC